MSGYAFSSLDELGQGQGFRKVRRALGVSAFGVNGVVYAPGHEVRELGEGGLLHVEATMPRRVSNASETEELVLLVVGGKGGYVERDGHLVDPDRDLERRIAFGS